MIQYEKEKNSKNCHYWIIMKLFYYKLITVLLKQVLQINCPGFSLPNTLIMDLVISLLHSVFIPCIY